MSIGYQKKPCAECPWRKDQPAKRFPTQRYRDLAPTAYDMSTKIFACHKSKEGGEVACAGFIHQCEHNLSLRMNRIGSRMVEDGGHELHADYREMAVFNGVKPNDPVLAPCR